MLYQITAQQGDDRAEWIVDARGRERNKMMRALAEHAERLALGWAEHGPDMADVVIEIAEYAPSTLTADGVASNAATFYVTGWRIKAIGAGENVRGVNDPYGAAR